MKMHKTQARQTTHRTLAKERHITRLPIWVYDKPKLQLTETLLHKAQG